MKKKIVAAALACVLCVGLGIGGTLAWLTADTGPVTNTFTVGNIVITLDEKNVDNDKVGEETPARDMANDYKIIPGDTIVKDPIVHVKENSENCYVYVCIDDALNAAIDGCAIYDVDDANWTVVGAKDNKTVYKYNSVVTTATTVQDLEVFNGVKIDGDEVTKDNINKLAGKTITVTAFAHQSDNTDAATATTAALTHFDVSAI